MPLGSARPRVQSGKQNTGRAETREGLLWPIPFNAGRDAAAQTVGAIAGAAAALVIGSVPIAFMQQSDERVAEEFRQLRNEMRQSEERTAEEFRKVREEMARLEKRMGDRFAAQARRFDALAQRFDAYALQAERFRDDIRADYRALARGLEQAGDA